MQVLIVGGLLISSGCVYLATVPVAAVVGGAELALKGGDLYTEMKKADARQAFDIPFEATWEITLDVLQDLRVKLGKAGKNKAGDGGLIEARARENKVRIAVVKMTDQVSEVGIWVKGDKAFADLILKKIEEGTCNSAGREIGEQRNIHQLPLNLLGQFRLSFRIL